MNENKKPEGLWALKRPWDLPLKEYIKTFPLIVSIYNEDTLLHEEKIDYGIPDDRILLTKSAQNTEEEARATKEILDSKLGVNPKSIILVTSAFHMQRAQLLFSDNGFAVIPYPVDFKASISDLTPMSFLPSANGLKDVEFALREFMGRLYYAVLRLV
jgi:uncharacterized SAM-binding protein YcdF (DUF218 family)